MTAVEQQRHGRIEVADVLRGTDDEQELQPATGAVAFRSTLRASDALSDASGPGHRRQNRQQQSGGNGSRAARRRPPGRFQFHGGDKPIGSGFGEAVRPDKRFDKGAASRVSSALAPHGIRKLPAVLHERGRDREQAAVNVFQMLEVQRPFLLAGEFVGQHGVDRTADDSGLDERAGVDANDGDAVIHRVVVVGPRLAIHRVRTRARPDAYRFVRSRIELLPLRRILRMGTDQQRCAAQFSVVR
jgi:hypothetical protein